MTMFIPKEVLLNLAILFPPVRAAARGRHNTGMNNDAKVVAETYRKFEEFSNPKGKDLLELGPGQTPGLLESALSNGARSVLALDIEKYDTAGWDPRVRVQYYDGVNFPVGSESVDIVWSNVCLEHVRDPNGVVSEAFRVLRPGGIFASSIDLSDHYHAEPQLKAEHLKYSSWLWHAMTCNRSAYTNRVRVSGWREILKRYGFRLAREETTISPELKRIHDDGLAWGGHGVEDFATIGWFFAAAKE